MSAHVGIFPGLIRELLPRLPDNMCRAKRDNFPDFVDRQNRRLIVDVRVQTAK